MSSAMHGTRLLVNIHGSTPLSPPSDVSSGGEVLTSCECAFWALFPLVLCVTILGPTIIFPLFSTIYSVFSVTRSPLVPLCTTRIATESPDKSPNGSPDYSIVRYHMPSLRSPQHSAVSSSNPLWTASSWWTLLYVTVLFCDSCDPLRLTCI